ncbi:MAG: 5-oxoprolinase (ATP-hydrolyzing) subunit [Frankiaceae bacterium]|nr:5-oxoprolinase (ATP-hydrolyzing) subunit [Frankiaceae bacterium]
MVTAGTTIDLNCDLGESYGAWTLGGTDGDAALLEVVTSANVACGFHAGDPRTLQRTVAAALEAGMTVGAQVSYPDLVGFGRRAMDVAHDDLVADVLYQMGALEAFCRVAGGRVAYVKPHGALYNRVVDDPAQAAAVAEAVQRYDPSLPLLTLPESAMATAAEQAGLTVVGEGFADRGYTAAGRLASRREAGSVLHDADEVATRAVRMAAGSVTALTGEPLAVAVGSICVHSDTPGAASLARSVRQALQDDGWTVAAFARSQPVQP